MHCGLGSQSVCIYYKQARKVIGKKDYIYSQHADHKSKENLGNAVSITKPSAGDKIINSDVVVMYDLHKLNQTGGMLKHFI